MTTINCQYIVKCIYFYDEKCPAATFTSSLQTHRLLVYSFKKSISHHKVLHIFQTEVVSEKLLMVILIFDRCMKRPWLSNHGFTFWIITYADIPHTSRFPPLKNMRWTLLGMPCPRTRMKRLNDFPIHFVSEKIIAIELSARIRYKYWCTILG